MALYTLPKVYSSDFSNPKVKPVGDVEIDWSNPLAKGLVRYWVGNEKRDLLGTHLESWTDSGNVPNISYGPKGAEFNYSSDTSTLYETVNTPVSGSENRTFLCEMYQTVSNIGSIFNISNGTNSQPSFTRWSFRQDFSTGLRVEIAGAGYTSSLNASNGWHFVGLKLDGSTIASHTLYMDGESENASGSSTVNTTPSHFILLGNRDNTGAGSNNVEKIAWGALWSRALSDREIESIRKNPYQILKPKTPPVYFTAAAAGGNTLTADSGTYTYTGTAATLTRTLIMAADSGTYTYSGTAADLLKGYVIVADSGAYTYTGTAATLTFAASGAFTLTADTGAYTYTGTNADLLRGLVVGADSGAYTYTGTNAALSHGFVMPADSGAYSYTGATITFKRDRVIIAATGAYTYTGTSVALISSGGGIWTDKTGVTTTWNDQANSTTIWTDK